MVSGTTPILATSDILSTVSFYRDVLGFPSTWVWGDPPSFAGASWGGATLMFSLRPDMIDKIEGHDLWMDVENVDSLYSTHVERGADIDSPIEDKPWGRREYTVRDPNGYRLRLVGQPSYISRDLEETTDIQILTRLPDEEEFQRITAAAFGNPSDRNDSLSRSWNGVVAVGPGGETVGVLRIVKDAPGWFSIWDVAVHPDWQGRRIGSKIMEAALEAVRQESPGSFVYLFTFKHPFYERLGFTKGSTMVKQV